jgi:hypothetical protein
MTRTANEGPLAQRIASAARRLAIALDCWRQWTDDTTCYRAISLFLVARPRVENDHETTGDERQGSECGGRTDTALATLSPSICTPILNSLIDLSSLLLYRPLWEDGAC